MPLVPSSALRALSALGALGDISALTALSALNTLNALSALAPYVQDHPCSYAGASAVRTGLVRPNFANASE